MQLCHFTDLVDCLQTLLTNSLLNSLSEAVMPKIQYPPQGGEKHLCFTMFCTMMMSVISAVLIIYAVVIIYLPAKTELESTLQGPKMCTVLSLERHLSGIEICEGWSSCEEWCLSIVSQTCPATCFDSQRPMFKILTISSQRYLI